MITIEPPEGDSTQMPGGVGSGTPAFNAVNRGKRSVIVDLKQAGGREAVTRLARSADILT